MISQTAAAVNTLPHICALVKSVKNTKKKTLKGRKQNMIETIRNKTPYTEQLAILAEECTELAQAALKMRRVVDLNASPTDETIESAVRNMREEVADVLTCMLVIGDYINDIEPSPSVKRTIDYKIKRWCDRIEKRD